MEQLIYFRKYGMSAEFVVSLKKISKRPEKIEPQELL
jgi:hypothetical protein